MVVRRRNVSVEVAEQIVEMRHQVSDHGEATARRQVVTGLRTLD